jgi:uncharacterized membrane protein
MKNLHHPSKKEFQVERLIFFSDAVFAIAITLLIIEIKVPELEQGDASERGFFHAMVSLIPKFLGFVISFFIIGLYWFIHHRMFGYVTNYNGKLIWLNLVFLFSIVLMPFSTAVYSEYSTPEHIRLISPYLVYVLNICLTGVLNYFMWRYIGNPSNEVTEDFPGGDFLKKAKIRSLLLPAVFILSLLTAIFINPIIGRYVLLLMPVFMSFVKNKKDTMVASAGDNSQQRVPDKEVA